MKYITTCPVMPFTRTGSEMLINERYSDFLKFALYRIIETAFFYEHEAKICKEPSPKLFLYFLAGKKRVQHVILEMITRSNNVHRKISIPDYSNIEQSIINPDDISLSSANLEEILDFAHKRAEKELSLYKNLSALEEDHQTEKLLSTIARLAKDYLQDITAGYEKFSVRRDDESEFDCRIESTGNQKVFENYYR